jgi:two-component system response regulator MprA
VRKQRILIVDDESGFLRLLKLGLEKKAQFRVFEENDPSRALKAAIKCNPDLVLLDFVMPKLHGGDVAARIHAHPRFHRTPILFLSGTVVRQKGMTAEIDGFEALAKPISLEDLVAAIRRNLAAAGAAANPGAGLLARMSAAWRRLRGRK